MRFCALTLTSPDTLDLDCSHIVIGLRNLFLQLETLKLCMKSTRHRVQHKDLGPVVQN